jgi:Spy/CpxP family protein refolding chaperone
MKAGNGRIPQALRLTDRQRIRLREIMQNRSGEAAPMRQELFRLRGGLANASVRKRPDERKIALLAEEIGRHQARLALLDSRFLRQMASVLDRRQMAAMLEMKQAGGPHRGSAR